MPRLKTDWIKSPTNQTSTSNSNTVESIPGRNPTGLFLSGKVHRGDQHEGRVSNSLECSRKNSKSQETGKVVCRSLCHEKSTPHEDVESQVVTGRTALHKEVRRDGPDKPAEIEAAGKPRVFIPFQIEIFFETENSGIRTKKEWSDLGALLDPL